MNNDISEEKRAKEIGQHNTAHNLYTKDITRYESILQDTATGYFL